MSCADGGGAGAAAAGDEGEQRRGTPGGGLPNPYTCYVSACPEPRNLSYKHPEFLICYKCPPEGDERNDEDQPVAKYFCYPISLVPAIGGPHEDDYQQRRRQQQQQDGEVENIFFEYAPMQPQAMYSNHHLQQQQQHHYCPRMYQSYRQYPVNFTASGSVGCPSNVRFYQTYDGKVYYCSA